MTSAIMRTAKRCGVGLVLGMGVWGMGGCQQADYAADVLNSTPQVVFVKLFKKGGNQSVLGGQMRLGPGDRAAVGPVRNQVDYGAFVSVDMMPNPKAPVTLDIGPGTTFLEVFQDGVGGPLRVVTKQ